MVKCRLHITESTALTRTGDPFKAYTYDPLANLTKAQYHLVLGGESHELFK